MKKTWVKIKRGFLQPEHRSKMGIRVWLYMFIIDQADWDTGIIYDWTDKNAADELGMPINTLRQQRQELESLRYINCIQEGNHQRIIILKWIDPRSYSGEVMNDTESDNEGKVKGNYKGTESSVPLHSIQESIIINQPFVKPSKEEPILEPCNEDGVPDSWRESKSKNKVNINPDQQRLADTISSLLGIKPPICKIPKDYKASQVTWWKPISEMLRQVDGDIEKAERVVDGVIVAYRAANLTMNSPKSLLNGFIGELVKVNNSNKSKKKYTDINGDVSYE